MDYKKGCHNVHLLIYHLVFVVKWRKPVISKAMSRFMKDHTAYLLGRWGGELISAESDKDHIHFLVSLPPNCNLSVIVRSLKTQLSKEIRIHFRDELGNYFYGDTPFWSQSYFAATAGSVSMETVRSYIESQTTEEHQKKKKRPVGR